MSATSSAADDAAGGRKPHASVTWEGDPKDGSGAGGGLNPKPPAHVRDPLSQVAQSLSLSTHKPWGEADAVVLDLQARLVAIEPQPQPAVLCSSVAADVGEGLPNDLDHVARSRAQPLSGPGLHLDHRLQPGAKLEVVGQQPERLVQAVLTEDVRTKPNGGVSELIEGALDGGDAAGELFARVQILAAVARLAQASHDAPQGSDRVALQDPRQPFPLFGDASTPLVPRPAMLHVQGGVAGEAAEKLHILAAECRSPRAVVDDQRPDLPSPPCHGNRRHGAEM